jgi:hypothetical protein
VANVSRGSPAPLGNKERSIMGKRLVVATAVVLLAVAAVATAFGGPPRRGTSMSERPRPM